MSASKKLTGFATLCVAIASPALAIDKIDIKRVDAAKVTLTWEDRDKIDIYRVDQPDAALDDAMLVASHNGSSAKTFPVPADARKYFRIKDHGDQRITAIAERLFPLEQGSNFRDVGGYIGAGGKALRWGKIYRSGALPLLSDRDNKLLGGLGIQSIIDLRSLDERQVAPTMLDDRTGALFIANDYPMKPMMESFARAGSNNMYSGMEKTFAPQYRSIFKRLLADDGAVMYHCSAGQDRTGVATALILTALGVDRETILKDYHLSTPSRRLEWEMPKADPADYPGNLIVQYYAAAAKKPGGAKAEPLYGADGQSHLVKFFAHLETQYGSVEAYLDKELGIDAIAVAKLRSIYLE
jgi:protein-tyrosine phosphatase